MPYLFPEGAQFGVDHVVLHASSRRHRVDGFAGPLSIKTVVRGTVAWTVGGRDLVLDPGGFLVLGRGERYSMNIDSPQPVETACVFFSDGFVESVARDAAAPPECALDSPGAPAPPLPWISRLHVNPIMVGRVQTLAKRCAAGLMPSGLEEEMLVLARDLLLLYDETAGRVNSVPAAKPSTREELFRRVEKAREYMHGHADRPLSLAEVATAACLSRFHFHRTFMQTWRRTPHSYLTEIRLQRAKTMLSGGRPVHEVCQTLGFGSESSFSRLFRAAHGLSPGQIRKIGHGRGSAEPLSSAS
jgi:AraC family transcriptional regulator